MKFRLFVWFTLLLLAGSSQAQDTLLGRTARDRFLSTFWAQNDNASNLVAGVNANAGSARIDPNLIAAQVINVKGEPYNATGDGVTDDTLAFTTAIAAATNNSRAIHIPAGTYRINATIDVPADKTFRMFGDGMMLSKLVAASSGSPVLYFRSGTHIALADFCVQGASAGSPAGIGIKLGDTAAGGYVGYTKMENLHLRYFEYGIKGEGNYINEWSNLEFRTSATGLHNTSRTSTGGNVLSASRFEALKFTGMTADAVVLTGGYTINVTFDNCLWETNQKRALRVYNTAVSGSNPHYTLTLVNCWGEYNNTTETASNDIEIEPADSGQACSFTMKDCFWQTWYSGAANVPVRLGTAGTYLITGNKFLTYGGAKTLSMTNSSQVYLTTDVPYASIAQDGYGPKVSSAWYGTGTFADVPNARAYGAKGDNVTDDTAALQYLLNSNIGRKVYIPAGAYKITGRIVVPDGCMIYGDGEATVLYYNHATEPMFCQDSVASRSYGIQFSNLKILAATGLRSYACFDWTNATQMRFDKVYVSMQNSDPTTSGFTNVMRLMGSGSVDGCYYVVVDDCNFQTCSSTAAVGIYGAGGGVIANGPNSSRIINGYVHAPKGTGIWITNCNNVNIQNVGLEGDSGIAVRLSSQDYLRENSVIGCRFENTLSGTNVGVYIDSGSDYNFLGWNNYSLGAAYAIVNNGTSTMIMEPYQTTRNYMAFGTNTIPFGRNITIGGTATVATNVTTGPSGGTGYSGTTGSHGYRIKWGSGYGASFDAWDGSSPKWGLHRWDATTPYTVLEGTYLNNDARFTGNLTITNGTLRAQLARGDINVREYPYLAAADGTTDDTTAIEAAITDARSNGRNLFFPKGSYRVTRSLNFTGIGAGDASTKTFILRGEGQWDTRIQGGEQDYPILDFTGAYGCVIQDLQIAGNNGTSTAPSCGILFAREDGDGSAGWHQLERVQVRGAFKIAAVIAMSSEVNSYYDCWFAVQDYDAMSAAAPTTFLCARDATYHTFTSKFQTLGAGNGGNGAPVFQNCIFGQDSSGQPKEATVLLELDQVYASTFNSPIFYSCAATNAVVMRRGCSGITFNSVHQEETGTPNPHFLYFIDATGPFRNILINNGKIFPIRAVDSAQIAQMELHGIDWRGSETDVFNVDKLYASSIAWDNQNGSWWGQQIEPHWTVRTVSQNNNWNSIPNSRLTLPTGTDPVVNVRHFGALGDGSTDDTSEFQAAAASLKSGQTLLIPPGTYKVGLADNASALWLNGLTNITVRGEGVIVTSDLGAADSTWKTVSTLTHVGTTATAVTSTAHGLSVGNEFVITGASPAQYNGAYTVATAPNSTTFTYTTVVAPATDATGTIKCARSNYNRRALTLTNCSHVTVKLNFVGQTQPRPIARQFGYKAMVVEGLCTNVTLDLNVNSAAIGLSSYSNTDDVPLKDARITINAVDTGYPISVNNSAYNSTGTITGRNCHRVAYLATRNSSWRIFGADYDASMVILTTQYTGGGTSYTPQNVAIEATDIGTSTDHSYLPGVVRNMVIVSGYATGGAGTYADLRFRLDHRPSNNYSGYIIPFSLVGMNANYTYKNIRVSGFFDRSAITDTAYHSYELYFLENLGTVEDIHVEDWTCVNPASLGGTSSQYFNLSNLTRGIWFQDVLTTSSRSLTLTGTGLVYYDTSAGFWDGPEISAPAAPSANRGRLYYEDNGSGKTRLVVRFPTGASQVIATEP